MKKISNRMGAFAFAALAPVVAVAAPTGGAVVSGSATISPDNLTINQSSAHAIINWNDFSVWSGETVRFNQPSASAVILNRVTGSNFSQIDGSISANGRVILINPNGVLFTAGSTVDAAGLVVSTLDMTNADFNADHWQFNGVPNGTVPGAVDSNGGTINATSGGFVVLLSQAQMNNGLTINAPNGSILLANGSSIYVDPVGDGLLLYKITAPTLTSYDPSTSNKLSGHPGNDGIYTGGNLTADNGRIAIEAMVDPSQGPNQISAVTQQGALRAQTATMSSKGEIILVGRGSDVIQAGTLDASGPGNGSVTVKSDTAVGFEPPTRLYPCNLSPNPCTTGDGNTPPNVRARSLSATAPSLAAFDVTLDVASLTLNSTGYVTLGNVKLPSLQTLTGSSVQFGIFDSTLAFPGAITFTIDGPLLLGGDTITGSAFTAKTTGNISISHSPYTSATTSLDLSGDASFSAGGFLDVIDATLQAGNLSMSAAGYLSFFNSSTTANGSMLLASGVDVQVDTNEDPQQQKTSTFTADAIAISAVGIDILDHAILNVGTGIAAFGSDPGLLKEVGDVAPSRLPTSKGPNLSISGKQVFLGDVNMTGDYLFIQTYTFDERGTFNAPTNLFVNLRPYASNATLGLEQSNLFFFRNANFGVSDDLTGVFPGTTYALGGTDYNGFIFVGEGGPLDFGSHDSGVFFMTNGAVVQQSSINTIGPVGVLAGLTSVPPEADQKDDSKKDEDTKDTSEGKEHSVDRMTRSGDEKDCR